MQGELDFPPSLLQVIASTGVLPEKPHGATARRERARTAALATGSLRNCLMCCDRFDSGGLALFSSFQVEKCARTQDQEAASERGGKKARQKEEAPGHGPIIERVSRLSIILLTNDLKYKYNLQ